MKLSHYRKISSPLFKLEDQRQDGKHKLRTKPQGLWVSVGKG